MQNIKLHPLNILTKSRHFWSLPNDKAKRKGDSG